MFSISLNAQDSTVLQSKISGNLLNDPNGNIDGIINGTPISFSNTLYVVLYNPVTERVNYVTTLSGSSYTFTDVAPGTYNFSISIYMPNVGGYYPYPVLPNGYYLTGTPSEVTITGTEEFVNKDFGVTKAPTTDTLVNNYTVWIGGDDLPLSDVPLSGKATDGTQLSAGSTYVITEPPSNSYSLVYNGNILFWGDSIKNYDPALLKLRVPWYSIVNQATVIFYYKIVHSGIASENPASYTMNIDIKDPILPVEFGGFEASILNQQLNVNWETISEKNNDKFFIEISKNGVSDWHKIGEVKSKAVNGNSNQAIEYKFSMSLKEAVSLIALPALLAMFVPGFNKGKKLIVGAALTAVSISYYSCQKTTITEDNNNSKIFVRLVQVDKDGQTKYSEIKEAVYLK